MKHGTVVKGNIIKKYCKRFTAYSRYGATQVNKNVLVVQYSLGTTSFVSCDQTSSSIFDKYKQGDEIDIIYLKNKDGTIHARLRQHPYINLLQEVCTMSLLTRAMPVFS